jgi:hypothetical protein
MRRRSEPAMNLSDIRARGGAWRVSAAIFVVAVILNYVWELAQSPLYMGMGDFSLMWRHCFVASLVDAGLVLLIFAAGAAVFGRRGWFVRPGRRGVALTLGAGLLIGVVVEWVAVHSLGLWGYTARMPVVPLFDVGLTSVAQMLVLPLVIFRVVAAWCNPPR